MIFVGVFGVMFYSLYAHRKSKGHKAAQFHESATVEAVWTIVPFFILLAMAFPATKAVLDMRDSSAPEMTVKITAYQWKWGYDYLNDGFGFVSNLSTPLAQIKGGEKRVKITFWKWTIRWWCRSAKNSRAVDGKRCDSRLVGSSVGRQTGRGAGLYS